MIQVPHVDPIPLPAPIWLFKLLDVVTLSLHFVAMQMIVGGLLIAVLLNLFGRSPSSRTIAAGLARRLIIVMTYVINFGIPPLLFAQVLYGRAIYTSSVLIGAYWIGVVPALTLAYWLLYRFAAGLEAGKKTWWIGLTSWVAIWGIAEVYTNNMALMLRPEVWQQMYAASPLGTHLPPHDPTIAPRLFCVLSGGFVAAGLWLIYLAGRNCFDATDRTYLARLGGSVAFLAALVQGATGLWVYQVQPAVVQQLLGERPLYRIAGLLWFVIIVVIVLFSAFTFIKKTTAAGNGWISALLGFLAIASLTLYRDGIRDMTLLSKGFDVWDRTVVTNWSVVGIFLFLFVAGLAIVGWLLSVMAGATKVLESEITA